jgi:hypothetical protein
MQHEHVYKTLEMLMGQLQELERQVSEKKRTVNDLHRLLGQPIVFQDVDTVSVSLSTLPDEYYGRPMPEVIRTILEKRKRANLGAATAGEIQEAMNAGGYEFQTANPLHAKRGIYSVLGGDEFHRLPDGRYGLRSWYPAVKTANKKSTDGRVKPGLINKFPARAGRIVRKKEWAKPNASPPSPASPTSPVSPPSPNGKHRSPTETLEQLLTNNPDGLTASEIVERMEGTFETKAKKPARIVYSTIFALNAKGTIVKGEDGRYRMVAT